MNDLGEKGFGAPWTNTNLVDRMKEVGFKSRDYFDFCVKLTYSYAHVNAFKGSDDIWNQISVDKDIREKIEKIKKSFEETN